MVEGKGAKGDERALGRGGERWYVELEEGKA